LFELGDVEDNFRYLSGMFDGIQDEKKSDMIKQAIKNK
jgi:hypothetical protein